MTLTSALAIFISGALVEAWPSISKGLRSGYRSSARWAAKTAHNIRSRGRNARARDKSALLVEVVQREAAPLNLPAKPSE